MVLLDTPKGNARWKESVFARSGKQWLPKNTAREIRTWKQEAAQA